MSVTPNWNAAPEWANYVAMDQNGEWWWFRERPTKHIDHWDPPQSLEVSRLSPVEPSQMENNWERSVQSRPTSDSIQVLWVTAPAWANFAAQDEDGEWYWYKDKPRQGAAFGWWMPTSSIFYPFHQDGPNPDWDTTLTKRPGG